MPVARVCVRVHIPMHLLFQNDKNGSGMSVRLVSQVFYSDSARHGTGGCNMACNVTYKRFALLDALYTMLGKRFAAIRHQSIFAEHSNVCTSCLDLCDTTSLFVGVLTHTLCENIDSI